MRVPESDSILRVGKLHSPEHPATTMPLVFIPLNYISISKELVAETLLMGRFGLGKWCTPFHRDQLQFNPLYDYQRV